MKDLGCAFLCVGTDLVCLVLREWLSLKDISNLDRSYCSNRVRQSLLDIFKSPQCVLSSSPTKGKHAKEFIDWLLSRGIRTSKLTLGSKMAKDENVVAYLSKYGHTIKGLVCRGYNLYSTKPYMISCPNLASIVFERPRFCSLKPVLGANLVVLGLRNGIVKYDDLHHIINYSPNISHMDISGCDFYKRGRRARSTPTPEHLRLKTLDISLLKLDTKFVFALIRNSGSTLQELYMYDSAVDDENGNCAYDSLLKHCYALHTLSFSISLDEEHWLKGVDLAVLSNIKTFILWDVLETDPFVIKVLEHCNNVEHLQMDLIHGIPSFEFTKLKRLLPNLRSLTANCTTYEMHLSWHVFLQAFLNARPEVKFSFVEKISLHSVLSLPL